MDIQAIILSGGAGTRLWPLSREAYPKQFLALTGERTLLQETALRLEGLPGSYHPHPTLIVCNESHRFVVAEQLRALNREATFLLEPVGRNTAPALTLAALHCTASERDPVLVVMPADHLIRDFEAFQQAIVNALSLASEGWLVTLGIPPTYPETGFGYIHQGTALGSHGAHQVSAFVEKPDATRAAAYLASGDYVWNSGIFVLRASRWLAELGKQQPDMLHACTQTYASRTFDGLFWQFDRASFTAVPSNSIDYAVMEQAAERTAVVPLDAGWSDVGNWAALADTHNPDPQGNVCQGDVFIQDSQNNLVIARQRLVAVLGLHDTIVVETPDAVLVADKQHAQQVKDIVANLNSRKRYEAKQHRKVHRPWGSYEGIDAGPGFQVKRLTVNPGAALSSQMHYHRAEHWVVVSGTARVTRGEESFILSPNQSTYIPLGTTHRLENPGKIPLEIIEVQSGGYLGEDDIVRFDDRYNRNSES
jgi:mannose-1-phosphate guanylyltransferase/mannose-6-phosphate isomerase